MADPAPYYGFMFVVFMLLVTLFACMGGAVVWGIVFEIMGSTLYAWVAAVVTVVLVDAIVLWWAGRS